MPCIDLLQTGETPSSDNRLGPMLGIRLQRTPPLKQGWRMKFPPRLSGHRRHRPSIQTTLEHVGDGHAPVASIVSLVGIHGRQTYFAIFADPGG